MALASKVKRVVDAFFSPLTYSHYVELLSPLWTNHDLQARVVKIVQETKDTKTFVLMPGRTWRKHRAGQHIRVGVSIKGRRKIRTYSISSAPELDDGTISITVKQAPDGVVSRYLNEVVKIGDLLPLGLPQGTFVLPESAPVTPLFITGGSGITPVMAMIRSLAARNQNADIVHIHFARHPWDVIFGSELRALHKHLPRYKLIEVHTNEVPQTQQGSEVGRYLSLSSLEKLCPDWQSRDAWVCGPVAINETARRIWHEANLDGLLNIEQFKVKLVSVSNDVKSGHISFLKSEKRIESDGLKSILQVAEAAGLELPHGCRIGICHTCDCSIVSGHVRDLRTGELQACEPGQKIQICVAAPSGDTEFDV